MRIPFTWMIGWQRLLLGAVVGLAVGLPPWPLDGAMRGLLGWCCGAAVYLLLAWWLAECSDADSTRARAQSLDQPSALILATMVVVVVASVAAITVLIGRSGSLTGSQRAGHIALGLIALAGAWLMIHTIYGFHYAHRYYQADAARHPGLDFPGKLAPDYFDFLYYAFVIGMCSQVSDVQVRSREMRRITLVHSVLSFAFNMLVLALSINVVAGAI
ncbi:DUF1345 domain-containing protein [Variovorax sp. JS1663]|uniref:DUF1345 domain-containing protein n=1 Tax=Variovorax sp. JS1663 TaxID=1851577 RepID=UPI000B349596|nr:DUF1345 domain-containing protein [Variovorax sp. JS1663]OUM03377.1 hypothetical protein A8M77_06925 [Variovorax sp. JS1663]